MTNKYKSEQREYRKKRYIGRVKKIGAKLAELRQRKKYSLQLLAQKSHVNVNTIYKIEKGEYQETMDRCDYCNHRYGYDYIIYTIAKKRK